MNVLTLNGEPLADFKVPFRYRSKYHARVIVAKNIHHMRTLLRGTVGILPWYHTDRAMTYSDHPAFHAMKATAIRRGELKPSKDFNPWLAATMLFPASWLSMEFVAHECVHASWMYTCARKWTVRQESLPSHENLAYPIGWLMDGVVEGLTVRGLL